MKFRYFFESSREVRSANWILRYIDSHTKGHLNYSGLREILGKGGEYYFLKEVPVSSLEIQDEDLVSSELGDSNFESDKPIVVGEDNFVIDGRHRVVNAKRKGLETIWAYVPYRVSEPELDDNLIESISRRK